MGRALCVFLLLVLLFGALLATGCGEGGSEPADMDDERADDDVGGDDTDDDADDDIDDDDDDDTDDDTDDDVDDDADDDTDDDTDDDVDDDCDDPYEPNDDNPGFFLGDITGDSEELYAKIGSPYDIDKFYVWAGDPSSNWWDPIVEAWLDGIPYGCNYDMYLYKCKDATCYGPDREPKDASTNLGSEPEHVKVDDQFGVEDGGYYQVEIVSAEGYSCVLDYHFRIEGQ